MKIFLIFASLLGVAVSLPQQYRGPHYSPSYNGHRYQSLRLRKPIESPDYIDPEPYVKKALNTPLVVDSRIKAALDASSPSAASALEYMKEVAGDDICALATEAFLEMILNNATTEEANAEATRVYIVEHNKGKKPAPGSACEASVIAWRKAEKEGSDPVLNSALAFMTNFPNVKNGNPCAVSGVDYVKAIIDGKSHTEANFIAATGFAEALIAKAKAGEEVRDAACASATKAYFAALDKKPSPPNAAAMMAFIDKAFSGEKFSFDPVCWRSTEAYFDSYAAGKDELTSNLAAAETFLEEFAKGSTIPADSPCAAATIAYFNNMKQFPSLANKAAMEAFMSKMISDGPRQPDLVCARSTKAYFEAYKAGASELDANLAAAETFFEEFMKGSTIPADSPCAAATVAYFNNIPTPPSPPNKAAMEAFMSKMIADGKRTPDAVCAASLRAYFDSYKKGDDELTANLEAAKAFFEEFAKGSNIPVDSPCAAATKAYYKNLENPPSGPNAAAMEAFMDKMIADGKRTYDPVCAAATQAFFAAYQNGETELAANLAAAEVFFDEFEKGSTLPADSPCAAATRAYAKATPKLPSPANAAAMEAFMDKMITDGSKRVHDPVCSLSAKAYFDAWKAGKGELESNLAAASAFFEEFKKGSLIPADSPCSAATRAYYANIPNPPSPANKAAMEAFMDHMIGNGTRTPDPVCAAATTGYWKAWNNGKDELEANLIAAEYFFDEFAKGSKIPADSPCAAATRAYYQNIPNPPSGPNKAAMEAFMDKMIADGERTPDPVCAASTKAYWTAYRAGATETKANLAAAESFFDAFNDGLHIPADSPCVAAAKAYYIALPRKPSGPNAISMIAFIDHMVSHGGKRVYDPVCAAASKAFFESHKNGDSELTANLKAAKAFFKAYKKGAIIPADSPCAAATKIYYDQIKNKPSNPNANAMMTFIEEAIKNNNNRLDPVCSVAAEAYFDAYLEGKSEAKANQAAGVAYIEAVANAKDFSPEGPCGRAAETYMQSFEL